MKKTAYSKISIIFILFLSPLLIQCASQDEIKNLHYQLRVVSNKVDTMKANTFSDIQKRQATSSSQLDRIQDDILQVKGRIEELSHQNRIIQEQQKEHNVTLQSLTRKYQQKEEEAKAIKMARIREAEKKAKEAKLAAERAKAMRIKAEKSVSRKRNSSGGVEIIRSRGKNKVIKYAAKSSSSSPTPQSTPLKKTAPVDGNKEGNIFMQAKQAYTKGQYQKSYILFERFVSQNKSSPSAVEARLLMGESLYNMKQYIQAIMQYQKIITNHPRDPQAPIALFKQGSSFEKLSDFETAKMIYKKLISTYSASSEAAKAKERINKL